MKIVKILIPIKEKSERCPDKNKELIEYTLSYLNKVKKAYPETVLDTTIITDTIDMYKYLLSLPYKVDIWIEQDRNKHGSELNSIYNYLKLHPEIEKYIRLNVTNPCRELSLIQKALEVPIHYFDLITSFTTIQDRSIFEIKDHKSFKIKNINRLGSACITKRIADGAIYYTTKEFTKKCVESLDPNKTFWNSRNFFIYNNAPLVDIDYPEDLERFKTFYVKQ